MAHLTIRLLGPVQIALDDEPVTHFESEKARALLAYLAAESGQPHRREVLAEMFWPDRPEGAARANLRHALRSLRLAIGDYEARSPFLLPTRHTIQFNESSDAWIDVATFSALLPPQQATGLPTGPQTVHQLEEAIRLCRGPFLEDVSLADSVAFEEWRVVRREHFHRLVLDALWRLAGSYERRGEYEQALAHARRGLDLEPWDEAAQQQVMRLLALTDRRVEALAQYEACRRVLAEELKVEPASETTRLYEQIRDHERVYPRVAPGLPGEPELPPLAAASLETAARLPRFLEKGIDAVESPVVVAREKELKRLNACLAEALAGHGQVLFVTGDPGQGKTTLLAEFGRRAMEAHPNLLAVSGNCNAYSGVGDPYLPFRDVMNMLTADVETRWQAGAITTEQARRLWSTLPQAIQDLLQHGPYIIGTLVPVQALLDRAALWCRIDASGPRNVPWLQQLRRQVEHRHPNPEAPEQSHLIQQATNVLRALAATHPLLVVLDDLQWADAASISLLFHLARSLAGSRILIAGAYRPVEVMLGRGGERHPLEKVLSEFKRTYGNIWLDLTEGEERERRRFVDALLDTEPNRLSQDFRRKLAKHTGGHPLFTVELLRDMQARGDLIQDEAGRWTEGPVLDWETMPARVEGVIGERVGRLEPEHHDILSVASVEGEDFTVEVVGHVLEIEERWLLRTLARELEKRHRLVREQAPVLAGQHRLLRYRFAHALFQQHLYDGLGEGERMFLHRQIAAAMEELYQGHTETVAVQLARHYSKASDGPHALKYYALAGDVALASYANQEAEGHYRRGLELAPGEPQRAHLLSGLGQALSRQSHFEEAIQTWQEGIELYSALGDTDSIARLYSRSAGAANDADNLPESLRLCQEGLAALTGASESVGLADLLRETADAYVDNALMEKALPFCQQALEMAERLGAAEAQARALNTMVYCGLPPEESRDALAKAVALAEEAGLLEAAARARNGLGVHHIYILADAVIARDHCRRSAELYRQAGCILDEVYVLANVAMDSQFLGAFEEAEATLSLMRRLLSQLDEAGRAGENARFCEIWLLGHRGEWTEAARLARAAQADTRGRGSTFLAVAGYLLGWVVLESYRLGEGVMVGEWQEAEAALVETIAIIDHLPYYLYRVEARSILGAIYVYKGRLQDARCMLEGAREAARSQPTAWDEQSLLWLKARLASTEKRWPEALSAFEALVAIYQHLGWRWRWARALLDWADVCVARGEPGDWQRAVKLLRESQAMFEGMGISRLAALAAGRLQALQSRD